MFKDIKEIKLIQEFCKTFILKLNKGNGVALINNNDYLIAVPKLF